MSGEEDGTIYGVDSVDEGPRSFLPLHAINEPLVYI